MLHLPKLHEILPAILLPNNNSYQAAVSCHWILILAEDNYLGLLAWYHLERLFLLISVVATGAHNLKPDKTSWTKT